MELLRKKGFWIVFDVLELIYKHYYKSKTDMENFYKILKLHKGNYNTFLRFVKSALIKAGMIKVSKIKIKITEKGQKFIDLINMLKRELEDDN